jgi:hypothetical protein
MAESKKKLPLLRVRIPSPCEQDWNAMHGDARTRHCARCDHTVHDLSALGADAARELLARSEKLCVRGEFSESGVLVSYADLERGRARAAARAAMLTAALITVSACGREEVHQRLGFTAVQGEQADAGEPQGVSPVPAVDGFHEQSLDAAAARPGEAALQRNDDAGAADSTEDGGHASLGAPGAKSAPGSDAGCGSEAAASPKGKKKQTRNRVRTAMGSGPGLDNDPLYDVWMSRNH